MKKLFLFIFFYSALSYGQIPEETHRVKLKVPGAPEESAREYVVEGSAYINPAFNKGFTLINGHEHLEANLRYDALRDNLEILDPEGKVIILHKSYNVGATFDGETFKYIDYFDHGTTKQGFFVNLNQGDTKLYVKHRKTISYHFPENGYDTFVPPHFVFKSTYYIKREARDAQPLANLSRKEIFAVLWDKYSELRKYARQHKLHMRNKEEVIRVLAHYDFLKSQENEKEGFEN